jgi:predicted Rossmann fold flavoprotein
MKYDVAVIGGGPAGIIAAGRAGALGARVILLEKNLQLGQKLLITGGGRCNFTNYIIEPKIMASKLNHNGRFLISALHQFGPEDMINFLNNSGVPTKIEADNRVFPINNRSQDILKALIGYLKRNNVTVQNNAIVKNIIKKDNLITKIISTNGQEISAKQFILCTGGKSYPKTGSTGDGYQWLRALGHNIIKPKPSLSPIALEEKFIKQLEGLSLKDIKIYLYQNKKKINSELGDIIFTSDGISGPAVLNLSRKINELNGKSEIALDLKPKLDIEDLNSQLKNVFQIDKNKMIKNILTNLLPSKLVLVILKSAEINVDKKVHSITREERQKILTLIKSFVLHIRGLKGFNSAMITSGGVDIKEIDPKTMKSKLIENLYFAGEIIDVDGPTGGYNLQICWSTGYLSGDSAAKCL